MRDKVTLEDISGMFETEEIEGRFQDIISIQKIKDTDTNIMYDEGSIDFLKIVNEIDKDNKQWKNLADDYNIPYDKLYGVVEELITFKPKTMFTYKEDSVYIDDEFFCLLEDGEEIINLLNKQQDTIEYLYKLIGEDNIGVE